MREPSVKTLCLSLSRQILETLQALVVPTPGFAFTPEEIKILSILFPRVQNAWTTRPAVLRILIKLLYSHILLFLNIFNIYSK